jgi:Fe-S-cluster containining protein
MAVVEGKCNKCGKCCRTTIIKIATPDEEMRKILEWKGMNMIVIDKEVSAIVVDDMPCKFLSKRTNLCMIYNDRPERCRQYPNIPDTIILEGCGFTEVKR